MSSSFALRTKPAVATMLSGSVDCTNTVTDFVPSTTSTDVYAAVSANDVTVTEHKNNTVINAVRSRKLFLCVPVVAGEENVIKISSLYGDGTTKLAKLESVIVPDDVRARLGIKNETIFGDELIFECANTGAGVITVQLIAGGDMVGSGQNTGGMLIEKEIGIVAREGNVVDEPIGGWL